MTAITLSTMRTRVAYNLNNLPSTHPRYAEIDAWINEGARQLVRLAFNIDRRALNIFPDLKDRRWTITTTTATSADQGPNWFLLDTSILIIDKVTCTRLTAAYDPSAQKEYPVPPDSGDFPLLDKAVTGWPILWRRNGNRLEYWPTTTTAYRTVMIVHDWKLENVISQNDSTFEMHEQWHPSIIKCATAIGLDQLGWDGAQEKWNEVERDITATINPVGLEAMKGGANSVRPVKVRGGLGF